MVKCQCWSTSRFHTWSTLIVFDSEGLSSNAKPFVRYYYAKSKSHFWSQIKKKVHPPLLFNNASVTRTSSQKHLGIIIENQLKFNESLKIVSGKISKTIGLLCKLNFFFTKSCTMVISFMIKRIICLFTISWNPFSIMPAWQ